MRYLQDKNRVCLDADELVELSIAHLQVSTTPRDQEIFGQRQEGAQKIEITAEADHLRYLVTCYAHEVTKDGILLRYVLPKGMRTPTQEIEKRARGEAFAAAYAHAAKTNADRMTVAVTFLGDGVASERRETAANTALTSFFMRMLGTLPVYHAAELDRVCRRLPTMAHVKYPFPHLRQGQKELIQQVYRNLAEGKRLYACAPTGIGKTMSMLFPAVRGMGDGHYDKVFYLTPKNTVGESAVQAVSQLKSAGAELFAMQILAKEMMCPAGLLCRVENGEDCKLSTRRSQKMMDAALSLFKEGNAFLSPENIRKAALTNSVCPYELSLCVSELCDVIICDYNYLFDLRVYLKRYFTHGGRFCFLIDEAHNLLDRAEEGYSLTLTPDQLLKMGEVLGFLEDLPTLFQMAAQGLEQHIISMTKESTVPDKHNIPHGFDAQKAPPDNVFHVLEALSAHTFAAFEEHRANLSRKERRAMMSVCYEMEDICRRIALYDKHYITFYEREGDSTRCRLLCLDPSKTVDERLSMGHSAVLFSATLFPTDYYKQVLGGRQQDQTLELPSPFDPHHLCLTVMDKISTGFSARDATLKEVVRVILTTVKAKPGNYMVFCPSFAYSDAVSSLLKRAVPGLDVRCQTQKMTVKDRQSFLDAFSSHNKKALIGFCVMGGIYSEGIDLVGKRLIGAIIVGVGLPTLSNDREAMREYYEELYESGTAYAYTYPGMNRVMQAAGRVIRTEEDKGVVVLIDQRFGEPVYKQLMPYWWHSLQYAGDTAALAKRLSEFWTPPKNE